jgi:hypothetical protein
VFGVTDASTEVAFGSHTRFEQGSVAVIAIVIAWTVTHTAFTFDPAGVIHLYSRSFDPSMSSSAVTVVHTVIPP